MKVFWNYIFPVLFGVLIYTSIRLINDINAGANFLDRPFRQNAIEVVFVILLAFVFHHLLQWFLRKLKKQQVSYSLKRVVQEFGVVFLVSFVFVNFFLF